MTDDLHLRMIEALHELTMDTADWGVLIMMHRPGDVPFLTPIVPKLRGKEIVANGLGSYDLWNSKGPYRTRLSKPQVQAWLAKETPPDPVLEKHVAKWAEQTLEYYGVPKVR